MFMAHAPVGYITSRLLARYCADTPAQYRWFIACGMLGAIAPDFDWFWYLYVDHRQVDHHAYFTHLPITWLSALLLSSVWANCDKARGMLALSFCLGGLMHMVLDTLVGGIHWFAPFDHRTVVWFQPSPDFLALWWFYFLFHWSFKLELFLTALAFLYWLKPVRQLKRTQTA